MYGVVSLSCVLSMMLNSIFLKKYEKKVKIQFRVCCEKKVQKSTFFCLFVAEFSYFM